jgi:hypothetical protein
MSRTNLKIVAGTTNKSTMHMIPTLHAIQISTSIRSVHKSFFSYPRYGHAYLLSTSLLSPNLLLSLSATFAKIKPLKEAAEVQKDHQGPSLSRKPLTSLW